jgi:hypothetical protein
MSRLIKLLALGAALTLASEAFAAQVEIYDRATGNVLPTYSRHGRTYVAGEPGHEYEIRIRNDQGARVLAVTTVDGVNVVSGQTGALDQGGYVLDPYGNAHIEGWRKSMSRTAAFYFTKLADSYAARTGRPENVGVIGVALFRERAYEPPCCTYERESRSAPAEAPASRQSMADSAANSGARAESKLGTGHGRSEYSAAQYTNFERASKRPAETIVIYYDSERNLVAQGIIPSKQRLATRPNPFPNGFVPDP